MDGFLIKCRKIRDLMTAYDKRLNGEMDQVETGLSSANALIADTGFTGEAADAMKLYVNEVHETVLAAIRVTAQTLLDAVALYMAGYYNIDASSAFILSEEAMQDMRSSLRSSLRRTQDASDDLKSALSSISDLYYRIPPSEDGVENAHSAADQEITDLAAEVTEQESATVDSLENTVEPLLDMLETVVRKVRTDTADITAFEPDSFYSDGTVSQLAAVCEYLYTQHEENADAYEAIWDLKEQLDEQAEEREENGWWEVAGGVALVATGTVCIVVTAGAATPIVVAGAVAGGGTIAFGVADAVEGAQDIYYGSTGDIDTQSINYIKSGIFQGNEEAYATVESIFAFTASAMVPIANSWKFGTLTFRSGAVTVAKLAASDAAGTIASQKVMEETDNRILAMLAGMAASTVTGYGLNKLDQEFYISDGKTPSAEARRQQGTRKYPGIDEYQDVTLEEGTVIVRGEPNGTGFFTTQDSLEQSGCSRKTFFEGLQVEEDDHYGYRSEAGLYRVNEDVAAAEGIAINNTQYGPGGYPQIYIPDVDVLIENHVLEQIDIIKLGK